MAENTRRVRPDAQGNLVGGLKPMPEGERRSKTTEELITEAELRAEYEAGKRQDAEKSYRSGLNSYMRGSNKPFMFKPKPEDAKEANDARGSSIGRRDKLMGDDSTERNVLALGSGKEKMYRIEQIKGDHYIVNESHILSLKMTKSGTKGDKHKTILGKRYFKDDILDICIKDYLSLPIYIKESLKGYKVGIEFCEKPVSLEPYALGCWLGDGSSSSFAIPRKRFVPYPIFELRYDTGKTNGNLVKISH